MKVWRLVAPLAVMVLAAPLSAQEDPRLRDALRIAQEGGSDSARSLVTNLLRVTPATDTLYPQMLYTMGLVSRSVAEMRQNYSRVAVEYTTSSWADDALFRLGLLDYAAGNFPGVSRELDRIRNDYPDSPLLPGASEWAAKALFDQKKPQDACSWLTLGIARAGGDVELKNRLVYLNGRCTALPVATPAPPDSTPSPTPTAPAPTPPAPTAGPSGFGVQVGAVKSQAAADRLTGALINAGFKTYVVKEGALFKVRAGPYPDRPAAVAAAEEIRKKLGHSPFLVKEP
jgi:SPOR domain